MKEKNALLTKEKRKALKDKYSAYRDTSRTEKERPENMLGTAKKLFALLKGKELLVVITVVCTIVSAVLGVVGPKYLGEIIDAIDAQVKNKLATGKIDFTSIYEVLLTIFVVFAASSVASFIQHYIMAGVVQSVITKLRSSINKKLSVLPLSYFDNHNKGDILSRITNDMDNINNTLQNTLLQIINSVVTFFGVFIIMLYYSVSLSVASLSPFPISLLIAMVVLRFSKIYFRKQWKSTGDVNGHIEEMFTGHKIVKAFSHEKKAIEEFDLINEELTESGRKAQFYSGILNPLINFANNAGFIFVCILGGYLIISGKQSVSAITVFMAYSKMLMQPIIDLSNIANSMQSSLASAERVFNILEAEEEKEDIKEYTKLQGETVEFKDVSFSYLPEKPLIESFNLKVEKGQLIAIVGPTGAGKTTIVNLLMRFYEINSGKILIDGKDIKDISRKSLRDTLGMVLQDTWLFEGTIRENILYGNSNATEEEFMAAVKAAKVDYFVSTLSDGFDTLLEEDGANLSAGQRQLITIARAILASPKILILDEATSSVDTRTELQIQQAMQNLMQGRTNFVIAHRLSTIRQADKILVMNEGRIVETGTHRELLKKGGFYADIYNSQFML